MKDGLLERFLDRVGSKDLGIGIVGIGYVGLPVALSFAEAGFEVTAIDLRTEKVDAINAGRSHLRDVPDERVRSLIDSGRLRASTSFEPLGRSDAVIVCVPTPVAAGQPDLSRMVFAGEEIAKVLQPGTLFVLESTTYPGTTEELLKPLLEAGDLVVGEDLMLAYSPERIDPGNPEFDFSDIPKVVGGVDAESAEAAAALYRQVVPTVVVVSGTREAEMSKLIENTFRHVNIALVNELAMYSHELGVDIWEAISAAATKPFGFLPFWPSPGWGGHCIPLDPTYLSWRVRQFRAHEIRFIELAQAINSEMPRFVIERASRLLNARGKPIHGSKILGIGIAYKGGTEDTRESAGIRILGELAELGADIAYHDPLVPTAEIGDGEFGSLPLTKDVLRKHDLVLVFIAQHGVDWELVAEGESEVLDCANALGRTGGSIHRL